MNSLVTWLSVNLEPGGLFVERRNLLRRRHGFAVDGVVA